MATVFVEARPKGREDGPISDYVVEDHTDHVLHTAQTKPKPLIGRSRTAIHPTSRACGTSTTRRCRTTGDRPDIPSGYGVRAAISGRQGEDSSRRIPPRLPARRDRSARPSFHAS